MAFDKSRSDRFVLLRLKDNLRKRAELWEEVRILNSF